MASALSINNIQPTYRGSTQFGLPQYNVDNFVDNYMGSVIDGNSYNFADINGYSANRYSGKMFGPYTGDLYNSGGAEAVHKLNNNLGGEGIDWMGYGKAGVGAVMGLGQAYNAFTSASVAKKQFELNRKVALANLEGSQQAYNNQLGIQANNMYSGYSSERMAAGDNRTRQQYQEDYISQRGVGSRGLA